MTVQEYLMVKLAEKERKTRWEKFSKRVKDFVKPPTRRKETKLIEGQLEQVKPKTKREKRIERLTGRKWTPGQYIRGGAIGAGIGTAGHVVVAAIEGAGKGKMRELMAPRKVARTAAIATMYGAALPAARRIADVEAAKRGKF